MAGFSSDSEDDRDSSDSFDELTELKTLVLDHILGVQSAGSFTTYRSLENFVPPGISVDEIGAIRLPLSLSDAQSLIRVSRQAPFGKGNQTLVDETVRKTWEIDGSKVNFTNKAWNGWLKGIVSAVADGLGVAGGANNVRADLYKMLLYENGAMFKPHKEYVEALIIRGNLVLIPESTEKTLGMFGTLVICLPSEHTGGAVRLVHGRENRKFDTDESSAFKLTYIAW